MQKREISTREEGLIVLREKLDKATPFEMGLTEYEGVEWQLIVPLTSDVVPEVAGEELAHCGWTGLVVQRQRWLLLNVELGQIKQSPWSFAFDCNEPEVLVFLRQLLRNRRLMVGFPNRRATRLEGVVDDLVEKLGDALYTYIPSWKEEYSGTVATNQTRMPSQ